MTQVTAGIWEKTLDRLRSSFDEEEFNAWLEPVAFEGVDPQDGALLLSVTSDFYRRWISRKYLDAIREALAGESDGDFMVRVIVRPETTIEDVSNNHRSGAAVLPVREVADHSAMIATVPDQAFPSPRLNPRYSFEDFVVGESNRFAHAAAQSVSDPESNAFNPLFLYGPSGLGKTHLMQAIGHVHLRRNPATRILYVTSEQFINSFIESIQHKRSVEFRGRFRNVDLLLLDDVQFLMGKERTQQEVFHTFNALFDAGKKIVLTSDRPPRDLATLETRLRSRFEWGVIADIQPPDLETRIAILRQKARQETLAVPSDVLTFIAEWIRDNVRELEGALKRIKVYAGLHDCPITMEVAREVLGHLITGQPQGRIAIEDIQKAVCDYFTISKQQLLGSNRSKKFSQPRHLALYLCREMTDLSFPDIAAKFGGKDHTSVIYACRKIKSAIETDPNMASIVSYLTRQIQSGRPATAHPTL